MKKSFITFILLIGFAMQALAYDFEVDGIYYWINDYTEGPEVRVGHCSQPGWGCYAGDVVIPETVTYDGITYTVTQIGFWAFKDCTELTSISFPSTLTFIGERAFEGCTSLHDIHIPGTVTRVNAKAFVNTGWYNDQPDGWMLYLDGWCLGFKEKMPLVDLVIDEGTLKVADAAFCEYETLISVTLPNTLVSLGNHSFAFCPELRHVDFGESIVEIGRDAFYGCTRLEDFTLPETTTKIGDWAFSSCHGLYRLDLPNSITTIGEYAFDECSNLAIVTLPDALTEIEEGLFDQAGLKSITIPDGVTTIGDLAFYVCEGLKKAVIPATVTEIGDHAFVCPMDTVWCLGETPASLYNFTSFEVPSSCCLIVPCGSADTYMNSDWGEVFSNIVEDCDGVDETAEAISVFPNPTQQVVHVEGVTVREMQLYNALGQLVKTVQNTNEISISDLERGVYFVSIVTENRERFIRKIVKN